MMPAMAIDPRPIPAGLEQFVRLDPRVGDQAAVEAALGRLSFWDFVRLSWPVIEPATPFGSNWHLEAIAEHLSAVSRGEIRRLLINMPPRHGKSSLVSVLWPCWDWISSPSRRWLCASYAHALALRDAVKSRRLILSPWYQARWPHIRLLADQNTKGRYDSVDAGYRIATSVDASVTGEGGDIVLVDDAHNAMDAGSEAVRQATLDWWDQAMSTRLNDPRTGAYVIVMQRLHDQDLAGHLLAQGGWDHLCLPTEYEPTRRVYVGGRLEERPSSECATSIGWTDPRSEPGALLWPARFGAEQVAQAKLVLGDYGFSAQHQQRPTPATGGIFKRSWFARYDAASPPVFERLIHSWDTAVSEREGAAYSVNSVWGEALDGYYLLRVWRERAAYPDLEAAIEGQGKADRPSAILVEDKSSGASVVQSLRRRARLPIIAIKPGRDDKLVRARRVSPLVQAGRVRIPESAEWLADWLDEITAFPNSAYADQVDSMSQALDFLSGGASLAAGWDLS